MAGLGDIKIVAFRKMRVRARYRLEHIRSNLNPQSAFGEIMLTMIEPDDKPPKIEPPLNLHAAFPLSLA